MKLGLRLDDRGFFRAPRSLDYIFLKLIYRFFIKLFIEKIVVMRNGNTVKIKL